MAHALRSKYFTLNEKLPKQTVVAAITACILVAGGFYVFSALAATPTAAVKSAVTTLSGGSSASAPVIAPLPNGLKKFVCTTTKESPYLFQKKESDKTGAAKSLNDANTDIVKSLDSLVTTQTQQGINDLGAKLQTRKDALRQMVDVDAESALSNVLLAANLTTLSRYQENCAEKQETVEGKLTVFHGDNFESGVSETRYILKDAKGRELRLYPVRTQKTPFISGATLKVKGFVIDDTKIVFDAAAGISREGETGSDTIGGSGYAEPLSGTQRVLVALANFTDTPQPSLTPSQVENIVLTQMNNYYKQNSYNDITITGTVLTGPNAGWYQLPIPYSCDMGLVMGSTVDVIDSDVDFSQYDYFMTVAPVSGCGWGGLGSVGKTVVTTDEGALVMGATLIVAGMSSNIYGHELGHNFGEHHASLLNCGSGAAIADTGCSVNEYGDVYDMMGLSNGYFNGLHKDPIGWLSSSQIQTVTADGVYEITPMGSMLQSLKVLKIQRKVNDYLYVEYRQPIGSDVGFSANSNVYNGALLHTIAPGTNNKSYLIDPTPPADVLSAALPVGSTFVDPATNTSVKVLSKNSEVLTVEVKLGQTDFTAPIAQITNPTNGSTVPLNTQLSATASDNVGVTKVEFHQFVTIGENSLLATVTQPPYNANVTFPSAGVKTIYVKVFDAAGNIGQSVGVQINVTSQTPGICGDVNMNGFVDISDAVQLIQYIFQGGQIQSSETKADVNGNGYLDISDVVYLINYIFQGGPAPACPVS